MKLFITSSIFLFGLAGLSSCKPTEKSLTTTPPNAPLNQQTGLSGSRKPTEKPLTTLANVPLNQQTALKKDPAPLPKDAGEPFVKEAPPVSAGTAKLEDLPIAKISLLGTGEWCTGILVGIQSVLTAAHCFYDSKNKLFKPSSISIWTGKAWEDAPVAEGFYLRGNIEDRDFMDLAVVGLKGPFVNASPVTVGERPDDTYELKPETTVFSYGYSSRKWTKRKVIKTKGGDAERKWVIATRHGPAYGGDSGGPLMVLDNGTWLLLGVLQGDKGFLYSDERAMTFTWADQFISEIRDFDRREGSPFTKAQNIDMSLLVK